MIIIRDPHTGSTWDPEGVVTDLGQNATPEAKKHNRQEKVPGKQSEIPKQKDRIPGKDERLSGKQGSKR